MQELTQYVTELEQEQVTVPVVRHEPVEPAGDASLSTAVTPARVEIPDPSVLVDAFFHHVYRAYPFIDEERVRGVDVSCVPDSRDTDAIVSLYSLELKERC